MPMKLEMYASHDPRTFHKLIQQICILAHVVSGWFDIPGSMYILMQ